MVLGIQMGLDVINHQGVWKGKSKICIIPSMVAFNPLIKGASISWGLGGNSGARAKGDVEFILFWVGFMSWSLAFHIDEFHCVLTCIMAFFLPNKGKTKMCNVHEGCMCIQPGQKATAAFFENISCMSTTVYILVLFPFLFKMQFKMLVHKTFSSLKFVCIRAFCIFMLRFDTLQETRIACAYSLLPPPSTFTLNGAQFHRKFHLGSRDMLNCSKMKLTF